MELMKEWDADILLQVLEQREQQILRGEYSSAEEVFERLRKKRLERRCEAVA